LKLLPKEAVPAAGKDAKASPTPGGDDLADEENGSNSADADAIHRETLSILGDLIDLQRSPRTAGR
jgi:hypothetical protein